jgi:hypothetical protein
MVLTILPCAEPEQDEAKLMLPSLVDEEVYIGKIKRTLGRLNLLPVNRGLDGVDVQSLGGGPRGGQSRGPGA